MALARFAMAVLLLVAAAPALAQPARAPAVGDDKRVALVIGNATYKEAPLRNPVNDARAMATALQNLGFEVIKRENATQKDMNRAINEFATRLSRGGTGLFYYAGHGMQVKGRNYLLPVDAEISSELSVRSEAVDVDTVLDGMASANNPLNMVILDACRNNPFERRFRGSAGGLAQVDAPKGALIAYATAPGKVAADGDGANGLYTAELLRAISEPNLRVEDVFKRVRARVAGATNDLQVPWEASSLVGDFYFRIVAEDSAIELTFWQSIQNSADPGDFQGYLDQFPNGRFATLARNRLRALQGAAARDQAQIQAQQQQQQRQIETQRQADAQAQAEAQRQLEAQRAAEQQRAAQADDARRRADAERIAAMEAELKRLSALTEQQRQAAQAPPQPAPPPAAPLAAAVPPAPPPSEPVQLGSTAPAGSSPATNPQTALSAPPRGNLDGTWSGRTGPWVVEAKVTGREVDGRISCGNTVYRLRERLDDGQNVSGSANRIIGSNPFPTTITFNGSFPGLSVNGTGAPGGCGNTYRGTLQRAAGG